MAIDPRFGTMWDFDLFVSAAHRRGIKVLMDLVMNHTSTEHPWFKGDGKGLYCWRKNPITGWKNIFDDGSAWKYDPAVGQYYLHLFHPEQADLNWFPDEDGQPNARLVSAFKEIVDFWTKEHGVDGFRLDALQTINKDFSRDTLESKDQLYGTQAIKVVNAVFSRERQNLFLVMECVDPTFGDIINKYVNETPIDCALNLELKNSVSENGFDYFCEKLTESAKNPNFLLEIESHDAPRFPSAAGVMPEEALWRMFSSGAQQICLYQGQELGLKNPTPFELSDADMLRLDAETAMRYDRGESLASLRPTSRANARVPLPLDEYDKQECIPGSYLNFTKSWIRRWRNQ